MAADYSWFKSWRPDWAEAYCVTLMDDMTPTRALSSLGGAPVTEVRGVDAVIQFDVERWDDGYDPFQAVVGVAGIGDGWALIAEVNGFVGVTERLIGPMSPGRTIVSHFRNINAVHRFQWWQRGRLLVDFDLLFPAERFGAEPDALLDAMGTVGYPRDLDSEDVAGIDLVAAGFALAEHITGVACTPELLETSDFLVGTVQIPDGAESQRYAQALHATWCAPSAW